VLSLIHPEAKGHNNGLDESIAYYRKLIEEGDHPELNKKFLDILLEYKATLP
jgi:hypothetical protein